MRTNIDIDDELLKRAADVTGLRTKKAVVDEALRRLVHCSRQVEALKALKGSADWEGDLKKMRRDRKLPKWS